jgi:ABC-type glycerol-3-phosphate transport system substrate-binding protein
MRKMILAVLTAGLVFTISSCASAAKASDEVVEEVTVEEVEVEVAE